MSGRTLLLLCSVIALASSAPNSFQHHRQVRQHRQHESRTDTQSADTQATPSCFVAHKNQCIAAGDRTMDRFSCNNCRCLSNGKLACTRRWCSRPGCDYAGKLWAVNQKFDDPLSDNQCECTENKVVMCTMMHSPKPHCKYEGQIYFPGERFVAKDCCNDCACSGSGHVMCTMRACPVQRPRLFARLLDDSQTVEE